MKNFTTLVLLVAALAFSIPAAALQVTPVGDSLVEVTTSSQGATREAALQAAREQAVLASAGRVLLDDTLIRADDLLTKYLKTYAANFIKTVEVTDDKFTAAGSTLESRVFVDYTKLVRDMAEKRFLYKPAYQPLFAAFVDEKLDGNVIEQEPARRLLENSFAALGARFYSEPIDEAKRGVNLLDDPLLMNTAIIAAERHNVELVVTGTAVTNLREQKDLYYDHYYFYDCEMTISLVRVDTGEVLVKSTARGSASNKDRAIAISSSIDRASRPIAADLIRYYKKFWPVVVQSKSDYEVLLTGVTGEQVAIIQKYLSSLGPESVIDVKRMFATSAVLSVKTTADQKRLVKTLQECIYPVLMIVNQTGNDKFEVQVSG